MVAPFEQQKVNSLVVTSHDCSSPAHWILACPPPSPPWN